MFKVMDKVVYPAHGVAVIEDIEIKSVAGTEMQFFKLIFLYKDMSILVPLNGIESSRVRSLSSVVEIELALHELEKLPERKLESLDFTPSGWNKRHRDYLLRIQNGSLLEISKIYRDLMHVSRQKELSFGEKTLLQTTEDLLAQEIHVIQGREREEIIEELRSSFRNFFPLSDVLHQATTPTF